MRCSRTGSFRIFVRWGVCLCKLAVVEIPVKASPGQQALMTALFDNIAVFHNQNHIRLPDGGQSVGNHDQRLSLHQPCHARLNHRFIFRIVVSGRLV